MKSLSTILGYTGSACGFISAYYWYLSSQLKITPSWEKMMEWVAGKPQANYLDNWSGQDLNMKALSEGNMIAFTQAGRLNAKAAGWAALAILLGAISNILA